METHSLLACGETVATEPAQTVIDLAHELRQPLGSAETIACYLNMVLDPADERAHRQVRKIRQLVEQMACLLQAAVHLARRSPGKAQLIDVHELAVEELAEHVCESPWNCEMRKASGPALVYFDPEQLRHLIRCFAYQCRRHAGEEQPICFETEVSQLGVTMRVAASGAPFERSQSTEQCDTGGLALRSAEEIVRTHGGRMMVERQPEGGLRIEATIPSARGTSPILEATKAARASLE